MEVAEKLYDPERRRKEEEALKIEYHSNIAREEGIEKGIEQGASNEKNSIAKNLLKDGIPIEVVSKNTGLSVEELENLLEDNN